ncbi:glycoside hydrolase family 15 protein [Sinomonas notoginsengisoli]
MGKDGSIDWLCLPNFDSPACFAALLADPDAGRWRIAPDGAECCTHRQYRPDTLVLETEWKTDEGTVRIIDFMPPRDGVADVVRIVEGMSGSAKMRMDLAMRFDYGHIVPWVRRSRSGVHAVAGPDSAYLSTTVPVHGDHLRTVAEFTVEEGDRIPFVLTWAPSHLKRPREVDPEKVLRGTQEYWKEWSGRSRAMGPFRDEIQRSLITLKALTYMPTGGIVAAATTSLPEQIGGPRNWDYRYCWLRDATWTLQSLIAGGYTEEAAAWRSWLLRAVAGDPADLQIMYSLHGARRLTETELDWLPGYENSAPVRMGNAAAGQFQLDVWGEVLDGLALTRNALVGDGDEAWDVQTAIMEQLEKIWQEPDNGLWEMRGPRRHFTHSKVMAWAAADRMVKGVRNAGLPGPADRWEDVRDRIHADVMKHGFDTERNTFVQSYGSKELDASLLLIPRVGFLPHNHPRVLGTIDAIQRELTHDGFVLRYRPEASDDGLPGKEGIFVACSFWMVEALIGAGRQREAEKLFRRLLDLRNDLGLFSEEWDPDAKRQLGNTPQAFSHFALITTAMQLHHGDAHGSDAPVEGDGSGKKR